MVSRRIEDMKSELHKLDLWLALNVTKTLRRLSDAEYAAVVAMCDEANKEPHPNLELTTPWRYEGARQKYTTDPAAAMQVLKYCMVHLGRLTGRTDFQIVVLHDEGSANPWCVITESTDSDDDTTHTDNCASAETMELAICRFARNLHAAERVAEPANDPSSATRPTRAFDGNLDAMAGFAAAHG